MRISDWSSDGCSSDLVEAFGDRAGALQVLLVAGCREGGQRAAMKGALAGDHPHPLRMALGVVVAPRQLQRALHRLGAGIAEERLVGEGVRHQPLGQAPAFRSEEHTSELQSLMRISYAVFCLK